jgi:protoheme IX farnesyltransferase
VIGWAATTGEIGFEPLILFLTIFLWTPPHFWALSLGRTHDYARAGVPMLPVVAGSAATTRQILVYSIFLLPISMLSWALGFAGAIYGVTAFICGAMLIVLAFQVSRSSGADRRATHRLFAFSVTYLFLLFAALLADHAGDPRPTMLSSSGAVTGIGSEQAEPQSSPVRTASSSIKIRAPEV